MTKLSESTLADQLRMPVEYKGRSAVGQHLFANGSPLVNAVCDTLEEAVARFGDRIKLEEKLYRMSAPYAQGYAAKSYAPRSGAKGQELVEYGLGYMKRLLAHAKPKPADKTPLIQPPAGLNPPAVVKAQIARKPQTPPVPRAPTTGMPARAALSIRQRVQPPKNVTPQSELESEI